MQIEKLASQNDGNGWLFTSSLLWRMKVFIVFGLCGVGNASESDSDVDWMDPW